MTRDRAKCSGSQFIASHRDHQGQGHGKLRMSAAIEVAPPAARLRRTRWSTRAGSERDGTRSP